MSRLISASLCIFSVVAGALLECHSASAIEIVPQYFRNLRHRNCEARLGSVVGQAYSFLSVNGRPNQVLTFLDFDFRYARRASVPEIWDIQSGERVEALAPSHDQFLFLSAIPKRAEYFAKTVSITTQERFLILDQQTGKVKRQVNLLLRQDEVPKRNGFGAMVGRLWNSVVHPIDNGTELVFATTQGMLALGLSYDGNYLATTYPSADGGAIDFWDLRSGRRIRQMIPSFEDGRKGRIMSFAFSRDSYDFQVNYSKGSSIGNSVQAVVLGDLCNPKIQIVRYLNIDGFFKNSGPFDYFAEQNSVESGPQLRHYRRDLGNFEDVAPLGRNAVFDLSPNKHFLIYATENSPASLVLRDLYSGDVIPDALKASGSEEFLGLIRESEVTGTKFSPNSLSVAVMTRMKQSPTVSDSKVQIYDLETGHPSFLANFQNLSVIKVDWSADGKSLFIVTSDSTIHVAEL